MPDMKKNWPLVVHVKKEPLLKAGDVHVRVTLGRLFQLTTEIAQQTPANNSADTLPLL